MVDVRNVQISRDFLGLFEPNGQQLLRSKISVISANDPKNRSHFMFYMKVIGGRLGRGGSLRLYDYKGEITMRVLRFYALVGGVPKRDPEKGDFSDIPSYVISDAKRQYRHLS